jgi:selenophosphate synthetase-related protein
MAVERWWFGLVHFQRLEEGPGILPESSLGAFGWLLALAPDEETAVQRLVSDVEHEGVRVLAVTDVCEASHEDEIEEVSEHLAENFRNLEPGAQTVWGTIHCYKGEGET